MFGCRFVASQVALNEGNALCGTKHVEPSDRDCRFAPPMMVHARCPSLIQCPRLDFQCGGLWVTQQARARTALVTADAAPTQVVQAETWRGGEQTKQTSLRYTWYRYTCSQEVDLSSCCSSMGLALWG